eukprot:12938293-Prorocentrum_lima.AAC.1
MDWWFVRQLSPLEINVCMKIDATRFAGGRSSCRIQLIRQSDPEFEDADRCRATSNAVIFEDAWD